MREFVFACLVIISCRLMAAYCFCTFDDAFTTYRYAQNLASGNGLVYNLHEHVLGTTAPLFAIIGTLPVLLSVSVPKFFVVFNVFCDLGSLYLLFRFITNKDKSWLLLFTLLFSLDPTASRIAVGGMEANLFLFGSLLALVCYFHNRKIAAFATLAVLYFLRPEALLLLSIMIYYEWHNSKKIPWKYGIVTLLFLVTGLSMEYLYYGHFIPQSVITKNSWNQSDFRSLVRDIFFPHAINYLIFPLALYGMIAMFRFGRYFKIIALWFVCYAAAYCIRGPWILNWYIYSMEVSQLFFAAFTLKKICLQMSSDLFRRIFLTANSIAIPVWFLICYEMGRSGVETNVYDQLKVDFMDQKQAVKNVIFADDIGAIGFYSGAYIYDNLGLVTPGALQYKSSRENILRLNADYLFLYTDTRYLRLMTEDSTLSSKYVFVKRYGRNGAKTLPIKALDGNKDYVQDYILWRRKDLGN